MKKFKFLVVLSAVATMGLSSCTTPPAPKHEHDLKWNNPIGATCLAEGREGYYSCSGCEEIFDANHEPTTLEALKTAKADHEYGNLVPAQAAGCETEGNIDYYHCEVCGKYFNSSKVEVQSVTTPAAGHSYHHVDASAGDCEHNAIAEHYTCDNCDKVFDADKHATTLDALKGELGKHDLQHHDAVQATYETTGNVEYYECKLCGKKYANQACEEELPTEIIPKLSHFTNVNFTVAGKMLCEEKNDTVVYLSEVEQVSNNSAFLSLGQLGELKYFEVSADFVNDGPWMDVGIGFTFKSAGKVYNFLMTVDDMYGNGNVNQGLLSDMICDGSATYNVPGCNDTTDNSHRLAITEAQLEAGTVDGVTITTGGESIRPMKLSLTMRKDASGLHLALGNDQFLNYSFEKFVETYTQLTVDSTVTPIVGLRKHRAEGGSHTEISNIVLKELNIAEANGATKVAAQEFDCCTIVEHYANEATGKYFSADGISEVTYESLIVEKQGGHAFDEHQAKQATCGEAGNNYYKVCTACGMVFDEQGEVTTIEDETLAPSGNHTPSVVQSSVSTYETQGNSEYVKCDVCGKCFADDTCAEEINPEDKKLPTLSHFTNIQFSSKGKMTCVEKNDEVVYLSEVEQVSNNSAFLSLGQLGELKYFEIAADFVNDGAWIDDGLGFTWTHEEKTYNLLMTVDDMYGNGNASQGLLSDMICDGSGTYNVPDCNAATATSHRLGVTEAELEAGTVDGVTITTGGESIRPMKLSLKMRKDASGLHLSLGSDQFLNYSFDKIIQTYPGLDADSVVTPVVGIRKHRAEGGSHAEISNISLRELNLAESCGATKVAAQEFDCCTVGEHYYDEATGKYYSADGTTEVAYLALISEKGGGHLLQEHLAKEASCTEDGNLYYKDCSACGMIFDGESNVKSLEDVIIPKTGHGTLVPHQATEASLDNDGCVAYVKCDQCGKCYTDDTCTTEIAEKDTVIPKWIKSTSFNYEGQLTHGTATSDDVAAVDSDGNPQITYKTKSAAHVHSLPFDVEATKRNFEASITMDFKQNRTGSGLGVRWVENGKTHLYMFAITDMYKSGTNGLLLDVYHLVDEGDTHKFMNLTNDAKAITRYVLSHEELTANKYNSDGKSYNVIDDTSGSQHELTVTISMVRDANGLTFYIGSQYWYKCYYNDSKINTAIGSCFTADTEVTPVIASRFHNPAATNTVPAVVGISNASLLVK